MKRIIVALILAALAGQASATIGSVISSFYMGTITNPWAGMEGIYRDSTYVYAILQNGPGISLVRYSPSGGSPAYFLLIHIGPMHPAWGDMTDCHLGPGYFAFCIEEYYNWPCIYSTTVSGSIVQSFPAWGDDIMWDGRYYHVYDETGTYDRYTPAGASAGQWTVAGWPAGMEARGSTFSKSFNNAAGRYLFVAGSGALIYVFDMNGGSLLASWPWPSPTRRCFGLDYGDAYPASYGGALWFHDADFSPSEHWAYQIDVDARGASVLPASIGKIKAIYR